MGLQHTSAPATRFPFWLLKHITDNFSEERIIGYGGFGVVYKGVLDNGEVIAVKKILYNGGFGEAQFKNELMIHLTGVQHQNIVPLVGYCDDTRNIFAEYEGEVVLAAVEERALCFEYLQGGSLDGHLSDELCGLGWHARYKIIKGICEGLKYLHTRSEGSIYHLDLKPANILLDKNMRPKIGDFGISRRLGSMQTYVTETVTGTFGYMPPEYILCHEISPKFDIFSLGVLMIHVIAGQEGYNKYADMPSQKFIERVHENWGSRLGATMSWHTSRQFKPCTEIRQVKSCTEIALRCVEYDQVNRPTITEIVDELNKIDDGKSSRIGQTMEEEHTTLGAKIQDHWEQLTTEEFDSRHAKLRGDKHKWHENVQKGIESLCKELAVIASLIELSLEGEYHVEKVWIEKVLFVSMDVIDVLISLSEGQHLQTDLGERPSEGQHLQTDLGERPRDPLSGLNKVSAAKMWRRSRPKTPRRHPSQVVKTQNWKRGSTSPTSASWARTTRV